MSTFMDQIRADRLVTVAARLNIYDGARKYFTLLSLVVGPVLLVINAPFGRFSPKKESIFTVDGIKSWMVMEIVSPLSFLACFYLSPISLSPENDKNIPQLILAACYLIHYTNRAIISPLRAPSRSKSHLIVPLCAVCFNAINGSLMGSYLSSRETQHFLSSALQRPSFWLGLALWTLGLTGNILHDEILYDLRRTAKQSQKKESGVHKSKEHYAIPHGWLYEYISYPNYFCEWVEWIGFALSACPLPYLSLSSIWEGTKSVANVASPGESYAPFLSPPWIFLLAEVALMFPRAYKGHIWYKRHFGARYPEGRKIVIPYLL